MDYNENHSKNDNYESYALYLDGFVIVLKRNSYEKIIKYLNFDLLTVSPRSLSSDRSILSLFLFLVFQKFVNGKQESFSLQHECVMNLFYFKYSRLLLNFPCTQFFCLIFLDVSSSLGKLLLA